MLEADIRLDVPALAWNVIDALARVDADIALDLAGWGHCGQDLIRSCPTADAHEAYCGRNPNDRYQLHRKAPRQASVRPSQRMQSLTILSSARNDPVCGVSCI